MADKNKDQKTPARDEKSLWQEFKEFVVRKNVVELAVGLTVGASFTAVVNSLVNDIILPPIGLLLQGSSFEQLHIVLSGKDYESLEAAEAAGAPVLKYGAFISQLIDFLIIAIVIFFIVKAVRRFNDKLNENNDQGKN